MSETQYWMVLLIYNLINILELKEYMDGALEEIADRHHKEIDFLYKEVGILRCEMDLLA